MLALSLTLAVANPAGVSSRDAQDRTDTQAVVASDDERQQDQSGDAQAVIDLDRDPFSDPIEVLDTLSQRPEAEQDRVKADAYYIQGRVLRRRGELAKALRSYQRAWRYLQPIRTERLTEAETENIAPADQTDELVRLAEMSAEEVGGELLELCVTMEREFEAVRYARLISPSAVSDPANLLELASLLTEDESYETAVGYYRQWLRVSPDEANSNVVLLVRLEIGRLCYLSDRFDDAADEFQIVLAAYEAAGESRGGRLRLRSLLSDAERTFALIGEGFLEARRLDQAASAFERANEAEPDADRLNLNLARVALAKGELADAEDRIFDLIKVASESPQLRELQEEGCSVLRQITVAQNKNAESPDTVWLERLHNLLVDHPHLNEINSGLAEALEKAGEREDAIAAYEQRWERSPSTQVADRLISFYAAQSAGDPLVELLVDVWKATGDLEVVDEQRNRFTVSAPAGETILRVLETPGEWLETAEPARLIVGAVLCSRLGKPELADQFFANLGMFSEGEDYDRLERQWVLELLASEHFDRAVDVLERRLERSPDQAVETRFLLSGALGMLDRNEEAAGHIDEVQAIITDSIVVRSRVGWVKQRQKDFEGARSLYLSNITQFDKSFDDGSTRDQLRQVRMILAGIASERGLIAEAEEWLDQVLDEYPDDAGALNDLGYLWVNNRVHLGRGYMMVKRAVESEPENASYLDSLGWAAFRLERFDEAEEVLLRALELRAGDPESLDHLGDVYSASGRTEKAVEAWKQAAEIYKRDDSDDRWNELQQKIKSHETN